MSRVKEKMDYKAMNAGKRLAVKEATKVKNANDHKQNGVKASKWVVKRGKGDDSRLSNCKGSKIQSNKTTLHTDNVEDD